jgi:hypothetical protein
VDTSAITALSGDVTAAINQAFAAEAAGQPATSLAPPATAPVAQPQAVAPVPPQQPVPQAQPAQSPSLQPQEAVAAPTPEQQQAVEANAINDQALYQVPQSDGTVATLSGKELREGVLRQRDYTQKTQALAKQRQEVEAVLPTLQQLQQKLAAYDADVQNPEVLARYIARNFGPQFVSQYLQPMMQVPAPTNVPAPVTDPNEFASQGFVAQQAQTLAQQIAQQQQQLVQLQQQLQAEAQAREQSHQQAREQAVNEVQVMQNRAAINAAIPNIIDAHPIIKAIPHHEELLRFNVLQNYRPQTVQEAVQCFQIEAAKLQQGLVAAHQAQQKTQLVQQQQQALVNNGVAAVTGTPLTAQHTGPRTFITADGKGDWGALRTGLTEFMQQSFAANGR